MRCRRTGSVRMPFPQAPATAGLLFWRGSCTGSAGMRAPAKPNAARKPASWRLADAPPGMAGRQAADALWSAGPARVPRRGGGGTGGSPAWGVGGARQNRGAGTASGHALRIRRRDHRGGEWVFAPLTAGRRPARVAYGLRFVVPLCDAPGGARHPPCPKICLHEVLESWWI